MPEFSPQREKAKGGRSIHVSVSYTTLKEAGQAEGTDHTSGSLLLSPGREKHVWSIPNISSQ